MIINGMIIIILEIINITDLIAITTKIDIPSITL